jgi:hypothetical protein
LALSWGGVLTFFNLFVLHGLNLHTIFINKLLSMKKYLSILAVLFFPAFGFTGCQDTEPTKVTSPDGNITVEVRISEGGKLLYEVQSGQQQVLQSSRLGIQRSDADFTQNLEIIGVSDISRVVDNYALMHGKQKEVTYDANEAVIQVSNVDGKLMEVIFRVSDDGVAFRYHFPGSADKKVIIENEITSFVMPMNTKGWLQPVSKAKTGFAETNPSYEENYLQEVPAEIDSPIGFGWVYPALFQTNGVWLLLTETSLSANYCGTHLENEGNSYRVAFPQPEEVMPQGAINPEGFLPMSTPWRILTIGDLATLTESTLGTDLAEPAIDVDFSFVEPGVASWSWVILKDESVNYETQKDFIDFAAEMKWSYCLVDGLWDEQIGREKIADLSEYAQSKGVGLLLWYNSAGSWNSAYQTPKNKMLTHESRVKEFEWMNEIGIKGIKVDFFGGDGQSVIAYYHEILRDAAEYGIMLNFHGATLPRGWARTYPNLMTVEAIKGYEFITFGQETADNAPTHMAMTPFTRNVFDPMDFTPINLGGIPNIDRRTTNGFELALSVVFTSGIQHIAETPEGMATVPDYVKDFLTGFPGGDWDETKFIDGYPGKLAVIARRHGNQWYVAGINGENLEKVVKLELPFVSGTNKAVMITDGEEGILSFSQEEISLNENQPSKVTIKPNGGFVMVLEN